MKTVMIVDDSLIMRKNLRKILESMNYNIIYEAKTGKEAVDNYAKYMPNLVTMDITMPIMNGVTATKEINSKFKKTNIVMVTSHGDENLVLDAIKSGAKGYILKPPVKEKVQKVLSKIF